MLNIKEMSDHEATATDDSFKNFTHRLKQNKQTKTTNPP